MKAMNLGSRSARHVPLEILTEILVHLPCESLARSKIVCKQWYSCINNSRYFLEKHSTIHPPYFLSLGHTPSEASGAESCVSTETTRPVHFSSVVVVADGNGHRHQSYNDKTVPSCYDSVVSSSCGYVCLRGGTSNRSLAVFNPTTKDIVTLPDLTDVPPDQSSDGSSPLRYILSKLGFGYDIKSKKYKVVHMLGDCHTRISSCSVLTVSRWCSSSSSSWRAVHDEPLPSPPPRRTVGGNMYVSMEFCTG